MRLYEPAFTLYRWLSPRRKTGEEGTSPGFRRKNAQSILLRLVVAPTHLRAGRVSSTDLGNLPPSTHGYILIRLLCRRGWFIPRRYKSLVGSQFTTEDADDLSKTRISLVSARAYSTYFLTDRVCSEMWQKNSFFSSLIHYTLTDTCVSWLNKLFIYTNWREPNLISSFNHVGKVIFKVLYRNYPR